MMVLRDGFANVIAVINTLSALTIFEVEEHVLVDA